MNTHTKRTLAGYLASAAISISAGTVNAKQPQLEELPIKLVDDVLVEVTMKDWKPHEKVAVLSMAAQDHRVSVRRSVCEQISAMNNQIPWREVSPILEKLSSDKDVSVRNEVGQALFAAVKNAKSGDKTQIINEWTFSPSPWKRLAVAHALAEDFQCLGVGSMARHLSMDPNAEIRLAVVNISASRRNEDPLHHHQLLQTLSNDPNRRVRRTARRVLSAIDQL